MIKAIISLESTCDLDKELINKYNLKIIDMSFSIGTDDYSTDLDDVNSTCLYERMRKGERTSTSSINTERYKLFFGELLKEKLPIIHLSFSSGLSNTYESALKAKEEILKRKKDAEIYVIDSLCACGGQGVLGILSRIKCDEVNEVYELIDYIENIKHNLNHIFSVDNLKYLTNGGRLKRSTQIIGSLLNIKPVMRMNSKGELVVKQMVVSRKKALKTMIENYNDKKDDKYDICLISHADCMNDAKYIEKELIGIGLRPIITSLGPIIGSHSGPGTISLYFIGNGR